MLNKPRNPAYSLPPDSQILNEIPSPYIIKHASESVKSPFKILIITCGGTLAQVKTPEGNLTATNSKSGKDLFQRINIATENHVHLSILDLPPKDSTNYNPRDLQRMALALYKHYDDYDAFGMTIGTDRMTEVGSHLSFSLRGWGKMCNITGSQISDSEPGSDAKKNLENMIRVLTIEGKKLRGFYITFASKVLSVLDCLKICDNDLNAFHPKNTDGGLIEIGPTMRRKSRYHEFANRQIQAATTQKELSLSTDLHQDEILHIDDRLGMNVDGCMMMLESGLYKAVVITGRGTGNTSVNADETTGQPTPEDLPYSLNAFFARAAELNMPVIVGTTVPHGVGYMTAYKPGKEALALNAIPGSTMTLATIFAKTGRLIADGVSNAEFGIAFHENTIGEIYEDALDEEGIKITKFMQERYEKILQNRT